MQRRILVVGLLAAVTLATLPGASAATADGWEVRVNPQVTTGHEIVVAHAKLQAPGYVVVYSDQDGTPQEELGASTLLTKGQHTGIIVPLNETIPNGTDRLHAVLHRDNGDGTWQGSAWDPVVQRDGTLLNAPFPVERGADPVTLAVGDQIMAPPGLMVIRAWVPDASLVTVHRDANGSPGEEVARHGTLAAGRYEGIPVDVPRKDLPTNEEVPLWLVLRHEDETPWTAQDLPIQERFTLATHQADVDADLQAGTGRLVPLHKVVADSPTWVVVHPGTPDDLPDVTKVLGRTHVDRGVHEDLEIPLDRRLAPGERVFVVLHEDAPHDGEYTFPDGDAPLSRQGTVVMDTYVVPDPPTQEVPGPTAWTTLTALVAALLLLRHRSGVA